MTKPQLQICNKLLPTRSSSSTSATVATLTSFELTSLHARVTSIKSQQQEKLTDWQDKAMVGLGSHENIFGKIVINRTNTKFKQENSTEAIIQNLHKDKKHV